MKIISLIIYLLLPFLGYSQSKEGQSHPKEIVVLERKFTENLSFSPQRVDKFKELDHTRLTVNYRMQFIRDTIKRDILIDQMILQVGEKYSKFFSKRTLQEDQSYTKYITGKTPRGEGYGIDGEIYTDYDMIFDLGMNVITTIHRIPFDKEKTMSYNEPVPTLQWEHQQGRDSICGYTCYSATTYYAGRSWKVWYADEIPFSRGPWKLSGLPGLILKAVDDTGEYEFVCESLKCTSEPIISYSWRNIQTTKKDWLRFERRAFISPIDTFGNGGTKQFLSFDPQTNKISEIPSDWIIPYNPIEKE